MTGVRWDVWSSWDVLKTQTPEGQRVLLQLPWWCSQVKDGQLISISSDSYCHCDVTPDLCMTHLSIIMWCHFITQTEILIFTSLLKAPWNTVSIPHLNLWALLTGFQHSVNIVQSSQWVMLTVLASISSVSVHHVNKWFLLIPLASLKNSTANSVNIPHTNQWKHLFSSMEI